MSRSKVKRGEGGIPILLAGSVTTYPFYGTAEPRMFWTDVRGYTPPEPPPVPTCGVCGQSTFGQGWATCQICGERYHKAGCGISTLSSFTCKRCMVERRLPTGYRMP